MSDQLKQLPPFTWRDVQYPVSTRSVSFAHESVQHKLQKQNMDLVEQNGAHNLILHYTIPMREDLLGSAYSKLFTEGLRVLFDDIRDKSPGPLFDPIYGYLLCVPSLYNEDTDANRRDGTDVRVDFKHAPDDDGDEVALTPFSSAVEQDAEALSVAVQAYQIQENVADDIGPVRRFRLNELLSDLSAFGRGVLATPSDIASELGKTAYWAKEIESIVSASTTPEAYIVRNKARDTRDRANRALDDYGSIKPVKTAVTTQAHSVATIAAKYGVTVSALLAANPGISASPTVPADTRIIIPNA